MKVLVGVLVLLVAGAWGARELYLVKRKVFRADLDAFAQRFHQQLDAGRVQEIIDQADAGFRDGKRAEDLRQQLEGVRARLGRHQSSKLKQVQISVDSKLGRQAVASYESEFENGRAREDFTLLVTDAGLKLYGYNLSSPVLLQR